MTTGEKITIGLFGAIIATPLLIVGACMATHWAYEKVKDHLVEHGHMDEPEQRSPYTPEGLEL